MYKKAGDFTGFTLSARDGEIGKVRDFLFDDQHWAIRHIVADTGNWLPGRRVLISPIAVLGSLDSEQTIQVDLTKKQIEESPSVDKDKPVSRQMEEQYYSYYGWPFYWHGPYVWGVNPYPRGYAAAEYAAESGPRPTKPSGDPHLRSANAVTGYRIRATDEEFGHLEDFLFDEEDWAIRYLIVDTRNWWPGKKVLLPPAWLTSIDWSNSQIHVKLDRDSVKGAPEYKPNRPITREYEERLHEYYRREPYWRAHAHSGS